MRKGLLRIEMFAAGLIAAAAINTPLAADSGKEMLGLAVSQSADDDNVVRASQPVELIEFDYRRFFERATQLGMLTQELGYSVSLDADGEVVDCSLSRSFDRPYTTKELCRAIARSARFKPAHDAQGNATSGNYDDAILIWSFFEPNR